MIADIASHEAIAISAKRKVDLAHDRREIEIWRDEFLLWYLTKSRAGAYPRDLVALLARSSDERGTSENRNFVVKSHDLSTYKDSLLLIN